MKVNILQICYTTYTNLMEVYIEWFIIKVFGGQNFHFTSHEKQQNNDLN